MIFRVLLSVLLLINVAQAAQPSFSKSKRILADIYREQPVSFYCDCDYIKKGKKLVPDLDSCGYEPRKNAKRASRIEWEHVMPAWAFGHQLQCWQDGGRKNCRKNDKFRQMEADMHNLVPAVGEVNGDRSNYSFAMIPGEGRRYGACDVEVDFKARAAEPAPHRRGDVARSYFYMRDTYGIRISKKQRKLLEAWAKQDPVDDWERRRNDLIELRQGNRNPYVK